MPTLTPERVEQAGIEPGIERTEGELALDLTVGELELDLPDHSPHRATQFTCYHPISCTPNLYCC